MRRFHKYVGALLLGTVLFAPARSAAGANYRDDEHREHIKRYYDRARKEYHEWTDREEQAFQRWLEEARHEGYHSFETLKSTTQQEYWKWRHEHPDLDRDRPDRDRR